MTFSTGLLLLFVAMPLLALTINAFLLRRKIHWLLLFFLTCTGAYVVFVSTAYVAGIELQRELDNFDLDGDGGISESEMTPEAEQAMDAFYSDTGRQLAPFFGVPVALLWTTVNFVVVGVITGIVRMSLRYFERSANSVEEQAASSTPAANDGNPYSPPRSISRDDDPAVGN